MCCDAQSAKKIKSKYESNVYWVYFSHKWETVVIMEVVIHVAAFFCSVQQLMIQHGKK